MPFLKLRTQYINLDAITHVDVQTNAPDDQVTSATVYFLSGHQDSLSLRGEDAQALVAAIDPPQKDPPGWGEAWQTRR
jgi:hypothetical protein